MVLFSYYASYRYLGTVENEEISYKILALINMLYLLMFTVYAGVLMLKLVGVRYIFMIFVPLLLIGVWSISQENHRKLHHGDILSAR